MTKATLERPAQPEPKDYLVHRAIPGRKDQLGKRDLKARKATMEHKARLVRPDRKVHKGCRAFKAWREQSDQLGLKETLAHRARKASKEHRAQWGRPDQPVRKVRAAWYSVVFGSQPPITWQTTPCS